MAWRLIAMTGNDSGMLRRVRPVASACATSLAARA